MKKLFTLIVIALCLKTNAQTTISGGSIYGTWTQANSPYLIQSAIMIPADSTLIISPGVTVQFQGNYKLWALGRLIAIGTISDTIVFTCNNPSIGWTGISYDNTTTSPDTSFFEYCRFEYGNASVSPNTSGGAISFSNNSKGIVTHSRFRNCYASIGSGAIQYGNTRCISYCLFENNSSQTCGAIGGGFAGNSCEISYNTFIGNYCTGDYGGAIGSWGHDIIKNNVFYNNTSYGSNYAGGAIYCGSSSSLNIYNNKFYNNSSINNGAGAIYCLGTPIISNNVFSNNSGPMGGAIICDGALPNITNNTFMNNFSNYGGAIYCLNTGYPILSNTILWGDSASVSGKEIYLADQSNGPTISYCDMQGGQSSIGLANNIFYLGIYTNNIASNPLVVNPSAGIGLSYNGLSTNLSLTGNSPCINTGNPTGTYPTTDIAGNPRIYGSSIDIGAYELQSPAGISQYSNLNTNISVYPNPNNGSFVIEPQNTIHCTVYDVNGKAVLSQIINGKINIDANNLSEGVYNISLQSNEGVVNKRLVIVR